MKSKRALKIWLMFKRRTVHIDMQKVDQARQKTSTGSSTSLRSNAGRKCKGGEGKDGASKRTTETLLMCIELEIRKQKLSMR